jgi:hypothetical protein
MTSFPHPVQQTFQGEPDYQTIHTTRKFLQANSRAIYTHLGGGTLGHLGLIISDACYAMIALATDSGPPLWITPQAPGRASSNTDGTSAQISAAHHVWEEDVQTYRSCTSVQQAMKKQIISVFEPMYMDILNDSMVGYAKISARDMLDHLFETYGNITAVDLEINFEHMRRAWDPQPPAESLFKQIQDCSDYYEAGGFLVGHPQHINVGYATIFGTRNTPLKKTWTQFKSHFAAAHRQHKHMQGESAVTAVYHSENAFTHNEDQMTESNIGALENLATATAADREVVAALIQANSRLAKQLEDNSTELRELKALLKKELSEKRVQRSFNPSPRNYFWTHGCKVGSTHTSLTCKLPKPGHKMETT